MDNPLSGPSSPAAIVMPVIASSEAAEVDLRLLAASSSGQTDLVLQLLEDEGGQKLHSFKDQVSESQHETTALCKMIPACLNFPSSVLPRRIGQPPPANLPLSEKLAEIHAT